MPIVLFIIGLIIAFFALYRFLLKASRKEVLTVFLTGAMLVIGFALFMLAITGRLPAALGIVAALSPVLLSWWQARKNSYSPGGKITPYDAREILGLKGKFSKKDVEEAYIRLMKKVHPDQQGSEGLAKTLNEARDTLLKNLKEGEADEKQNNQKEDK